MFKINSFRKFAMFFRTSVKIVLLTIISAFLVVSAVAFFYKPTYAVSLNGELIGYTENKAELQNNINEYMAGDKEEGIVFRQIGSVPEYTLCLLKKILHQTMMKYMQKLLKMEHNIINIMQLQTIKKKKFMCQHLKRQKK